MSIGLVGVKFLYPAFRSYILTVSFFFFAGRILGCLSDLWYYYLYFFWVTLHHKLSLRACSKCTHSF